MEAFMTPEQVSEWTGLSEAALAQLRYSGKGPIFLKPTAKRVLYRQRDVEAWIDKSARTITGRQAS